MTVCCSAGFAAQPNTAADGGLSYIPFRSDARWIAAQSDASAATTAQGNADAAATVVPLPIFRSAFTVRGKSAGAKLVSATLNISGLGQFEAHINGHNVTEAVLTPGWSDYRKRVYYDTYDVTKLVVPGENAIGMLLGNGMYNVESPANRYTKFRGTFGQPKLIVALVVRFSDGSEQRIVSDSAWKTAEGPIAFSKSMAAKTTTHEWSRGAGMRRASTTIDGRRRAWLLGRVGFWLRRRFRRLWQTRATHQLR